MSGSGGFTTTTVTVAATATLIVAARKGRVAVTITNRGTTACDLDSQATVTVGGNQILAGVAGASVTIPTQDAVYGIAATGTQAVSVLESF